MTLVRQIEKVGGVAFVPLTRGHKAIIDVEDVPLVEGKNWFAAVRGRKLYAARSVWVPGRNTSRVELMHRMLLGFPAHGVDHEDGDGLNNQRENLRPANKSQNARNSGAHSDNRTGLKGVWFHTQRKRWTSAICVNGNRKYLGLFDTPEEAHAAYSKACVELHGRFARPE